MAAATGFFLGALFVTIKPALVIPVEAAHASSIYVGGNFVGEFNGCLGGSPR
ncbi:MAG: hypothetical protein M5U34_16115 [Chloroflexi bacterium]|nr:hypothetical protein [Chloroflexota bacterium]